MALSVGAQALVDRAMERVHTLELDEAFALHSAADALFVDLREPHEIAAEGLIPGAVRVPRGTLEFRVDPHSPFFLKAFADSRPLVLYCQLAARSALAAAAPPRVWPGASHHERMVIADRMIQA